MIVVAGEALMDVLVERSGRLDAIPGGASFNVARIVAGLGGDCSFLGRLSDDPFGARLALELRRAGVTLATPEPLRAPTTLAMVQLDASGSADYRFYGNGTAAAMLTLADLPAGLLDGARALAVGGLGLVFEPVRSTLLALVERAPDETLVMLDPNCRPHAVEDRSSYVAAIDALVARSAVVKLSREDLSYLWPGREPAECGAELLGRGAGVVLVTDGPREVTVFTTDGSCSVPVPPVDVVDTIGAGDGVLAGLLVWFDERPQIDPRMVGLDLLREAVASAVEVAAAVCTMRGGLLPEGFSPGGGPSRDRPDPKMLGVRSSGVVVRPGSGSPAADRVRAR